MNAAIAQLFEGQTYSLRPTGNGLNAYWREYEICGKNILIQLCFEQPHSLEAKNISISSVSNVGFWASVEDQEGAWGGTGLIGWDHWGLKTIGGVASNA